MCREGYNFFFLFLLLADFLFVDSNLFAQFTNFGSMVSNCKQIILWVEIYC